VARVSGLVLTAEKDGPASDYVVNFDKAHTPPEAIFRRQDTQLSARRMAEDAEPLRTVAGR
jgi:hypothetical protein